MNLKFDFLAEKYLLFLKKAHRLELKAWPKLTEEIPVFLGCPDIVSSPGGDSRDSRSSRLAEATQKALGTNALCTGSRIFIWFLPHIYPIFTKSFF